MVRPVFSLKTMLWLMAVVGAFFGGAEWGKRGSAEREASLSAKLHDAEEAWGEAFKRQVEASLDKQELQDELTDLKKHYGVRPKYPMLRPPPKPTEVSSATQG
ncbi:MAG TPA: hypothetical protein VG826_19660 [Pirellulales bacterium]|nr:hypothetical protein [Pirellulales bacterium]